MEEEKLSGELLMSAVKKGFYDSWGPHCTPKVTSTNPSTLRKWLREKYDIDIVITFEKSNIPEDIYKGVKKRYKYNIFSNSTLLGGEIPTIFINYEDALEQALRIALSYIPDEKEKSKFIVGQRVYKPKGYEFPGTVVSVFNTTKGERRVVVEMDKYGLLHIFNESQLEIQQ